jgi:hypothetical protein
MHVRCAVGVAGACKECPHDPSESLLHPKLNEESVNEPANSAEALRAGGVSGGSLRG